MAGASPLIQNAANQQLLNPDIQPMTPDALTAYLICTIIIIVVDVFFVLYLTVITILADTRGTVKNCEKLLIFNVTIPDSIVCIYIFAFVCPATSRNDWHWNVRVSTCLGFLHLFAVFHSFMAMATICNIITYSVKNVYGYEGINTWKHLTALVMAYASLSVCFSSLPAVEAQGLLYKSYWFSPMMTVFHGFGGIFLFLAFLGIILVIEGKSLMDLLQVKKMFKKEKVPVKAKADLDSFISFVSWSLSLNLLLFVCLAEIDGPILTFVLRMLLYMGPVWRVMLLTRRCPHFNFHEKQDDTDMEELAMMGVDED